jgi:hypothetical protein
LVVVVVVVVVVVFYQCYGWMLLNLHHKQFPTN